MRWMHQEGSQQDAGGGGQAGRPTDSDRVFSHSPFPAQSGQKVPQEVDFVICAYKLPCNIKY